MWRHLIPLDRFAAEDLKCQVGDKKSGSTFGQSSVTTLKPEVRG